MVTDTSIQAFYELEDKETRQQKVYYALATLCLIQGDATDSEIARYMNKGDPNFVRPRRFELVNDLKLVGFSQKRVCRVTGKTCCAWKINAIQKTL